MNRRTAYLFSISVVSALILLLSSCRKSVKLTADAVEDRSAVPTLDARDVTTLISDSGVVRYRLTTSVWQVYDRAEPPYWEFPKGVYLEKFNLDLSVDAYLQADYAYYDKSQELWHLVGNVKALNLEGERFETPDLWWNQKEERVYSDTTMSVYKQKMTIHGIGFESNQEMTKYTILHPTGIIPVNE